jgi:hypothetical protein
MRPHRPATVWDMHRAVEQGHTVSWRTFGSKIPYGSAKAEWVELSAEVEKEEGEELETEGEPKKRKRVPWGNKKERKAFDVEEYLARTGQCKKCGEPYAADPLSYRCLKQHWAAQQRACAKCAGVIDYEAKAPDTKRLMCARIVPPSKAKVRGWTKQQTNALSNFEPRHASCR